MVPKVRTSFSRRDVFVFLFYAAPAGHPPPARLCRPSRPPPAAWARSCAGARLGVARGEDAGGRGAAGGGGVWARGRGALGARGFKPKRLSSLRWRLPHSLFNRRRAHLNFHESGVGAFLFRGPRLSARARRPRGGARRGAPSHPLGR